MHRFHLIRQLEVVENHQEVVKIIQKRRTTMLLRRLCFVAATAHAFVLPPAPQTTRLQMMPPKPGDMTPESMRQAADALKTLKPDQIQQMLKEVEDMSPEERERLKGNGPVHKSTSE